MDLLFGMVLGFLIIAVVILICEVQDLHEDIRKLKNEKWN